MSISIHPSAVVEHGAQLGEDVEIGAFCYVAATAKIGAGSKLFPHATVLDYTSIGERNRIHSGAVIGDTPQDLSFTGAPSYVVTGSDCVFREGVTVHRGAAPGTTTTIGNHVFMMANSHAAHNVVLGDRVIMANNVLLAGHVSVGERTFFGGGALVQQHTRIGRFVMMGGGCGAAKDVPPFCITVSLVTSRVYGLNIVGLRRGGFTAEERKEIKRIFGIVFLQGLNRLQAIDVLRAGEPTALATEMADFLAAARRGIARLRKLDDDDDGDGGGDEG